MATATASGTGTTGTIGSLPLAGPTCWVPLTGFQQLYQCYECTQPVFYVYSYSQLLSNNKQVFMKYEYDQKYWFEVLVVSVTIDSRRRI